MNIIKQNDIYKIFENNKQIGSIEFIESERYIQNIYLSSEYRNKGYLTKIIKYFGKPLILLPTPQHIEKFIHLGFKFHEQIKDDKYYILK